MKRHWKAKAFVCVSVLALFVAGCENSENPASDPEKTEPAPELHGVWRTQWSEDEVQFFHVGAAGGNLPETMMRMELVTHKKTGELVTHDQLMVVIPGGTDEKPILSAAAMDRDSFAKIQTEGWNPEAAGDYFLNTYRLDDEKLFVRGVDREEKRRLIETGEMDGRIMEPEGRFTWVRIRLTTPTEKLAEFLASPDADALFDEEEHLFERVDAIERMSNKETREF